MENTDLNIKKTDIGLYRQCFPNFSFEELVSVAMLLTARDMFKKHEGAKICKDVAAATGRYMAGDIDKKTYLSRKIKYDGDDGIEVITDIETRREYTYAVSDVYRMYHKWCKELKVHELPIEEDVRPVIGKMDLRKEFCKHSKLVDNIGVCNKNGMIMGVSLQLIVAAPYNGDDFEFVADKSMYSKVPFDKADELYMRYVFPPYTSVDEAFKDADRKAKILKASGKKPIVEILGYDFNWEIVKIAMKAMDCKNASVAVCEAHCNPAMKIVDGNAMAYVVGMKKEVLNA